MSGSACDAAKLKCVGKVSHRGARLLRESSGQDRQHRRRLRREEHEQALGRREGLPRQGGRGRRLLGVRQPGCRARARQPTRFLEAEGLQARCGEHAMPAPLPDRAADARGGPSPLHRPADPVVLTGADVAARLTGIPPGDLVAFRWDGAWSPDTGAGRRGAPSSNFDDVYDNMASLRLGIGRRVHRPRLHGRQHPSREPTPTRRSTANDEIVFMAADAGTQPPAFGEPSRVVASSGMKITVTDPLERRRRLRLPLPPEAARSTRAPASSTWRTSFACSRAPTRRRTRSPTVPTWKTAGSVRRSIQKHFSDRWLQDELRIYSGSATGGRHPRSQQGALPPGSTAAGARTASTGSRVTSSRARARSSPTRAAPSARSRSYVGANSGPRSRQEQIFYRGREESTAFLRVHAIPAIMTFRDFSSAAVGMTLRERRQPRGRFDRQGRRRIDERHAHLGARDRCPELGRDREDVVETNIPGIVPSAYYLDDASPSPADTQCSGDAYAYGASGPWISQNIPDTDPSPRLDRATCAAGRRSTTTRRVSRPRTRRRGRPGSRRRSRTRR
mgnify:CR=1 FL=1